MRTNYELYIEEHDLEVVLDCSCTTENDGIGSYEYWGSKGYDKGVDYLICENMTWDKSLYTEEQNAIIDQYIDANYEKLSDAVVKSVDRY